MRRMVFDVETAPLPEAVDYIESVSAPANYKDPDKINAYVEGGNAAALAKCALDLDLCQVVAIGWWLEGEEDADAISLNHYDVDAEAFMLSTFWDHVEEDYAHLVGFNCIAFDLPVLMRRSLYLGVPTPDIQIEKYRHPDVTDLMAVLSYNGMLKNRGLSFYARRFGLDVPDTLTGADIGLAVTEGRWDDIEAHVRADVRKTALLAAKLGLFSMATPQVSQGVF